MFTVKVSHCLFIYKKDRQLASAMNTFVLQRRNSQLAPTSKINITARLFIRAKNFGNSISACAAG
jgi:hypothetical protein